jgi:hypothetical protein
MFDLFTGNTHISKLVLSIPSVVAISLRVHLFAEAVNALTSAHLLST